MTRGQLVQDILDRKAQLRQSRQLTCDMAFQAFLTRHGEVDEARRRLARARMAVVRRTGDAQAVAQAQAAYDATLAAALTAEGLSPDAFTLPVDCPKCGDTGLVGGLEKQLCLCVQVETALRAKESTGIRPDYDFAHFDPSLFSAEDEVPGGGSLQQYMLRLRDYLLRYAQDFPQSAPTLVLTGSTGLGKTFLLHCVANALVERGVFCVLTSPYRLNQAVLGADRGQDALVTFAAADLLLIDDIGSEPLLQKVTSEALFSVADQRMMAGRPMILSTNLTPSELQERYGGRFYSRITDRTHARVIKFYGPDLRQRQG